VSSLTGMNAMLRLAIRRDRVKLPGWIAALVLLAWAQGGGIEGVYPTQQAREAYATVTASNAAARLFGAVDGPSLGSIMMVELFVFFAIIVALLCSMLVVRHTRQNEQAGRLELVRSAEVGRHAPLAAALVLALATCVVLLGVLALALVAAGLPIAGSILMAAGWAGLGLVFAAVAAVASQLAGSARLANGLCGIVLALAFLIRAIGDIAGEVSRDGMHVTIAWPSWLSPIGWGQLAYPFSQQRWWVLTLYLAFTIVGVALAVALSARRDVGRGMLPERAARARVGRTLASPLGLAVRLHRTAIIAWTAGLLLLGGIGGVFASAIEEMLADNAEARAIFEGFGGSDVLVDSYFAIMTTYLGLIAAAMALQMVMRLRSEERGPGEALLVAGASRTSWMVSHLLVATVAVGVALAAAGWVMQVLAQAAGQPVDGMLLVQGALAQWPAVLVFVGVAAAGFGLAPRRAGWLGWGLYALAVVIIIASALDIPGRVLELSPFHHVPAVPVDPITAAPLLALGAVALGSALVGLLAFTRRDVHAGA
jgi:ABC-2 type transport system permease protein